MNALSGQRVCIVGGTAGMGLSIAQRAVAAGAEVVRTEHRAERAAAVAAAFRPRAEGCALDILDPTAIAQVLDEVGDIDHLVVTAAAVQPGPLTGAVEDARATFEGKFWPKYLCSREATVRRSILLFSGVLSRRPRPGTAALGAVNGAVEALGRALAVELAPVRVNVLSPGLVRDTDAYAGMVPPAREAMFEGAATRLPAGLVGDADSIAVIALSPLESDYVTGAVIDIDGGGLLA